MQQAMDPLTAAAPTGREQVSVREIPDHEIVLSIDPTSFVPYYEQIADQVRTLVGSGKLAPGQSFWSEGDVATKLGISKMPVRQAFQKLRSEGYLLLAKGRVPVVGSGQVAWDFQELRGFTEEMRRRGLKPTTRLLGIEVVQPPAEVASALQLSEGERVYRLERLRYGNKSPMALENSWLPLRFFPNLEKQDLSKGSLYSIMEEVYRKRLGWAAEEIGAVAAGDREASLLEVEPGFPLLRAREMLYDVSQFRLEYAVALYRSDRYTVSIVSRRRRHATPQADGARRR